MALLNHCVFVWLAVCSLLCTAELEIGVCYYPEQWSVEQWDKDAKRMAALGITYVRIAEFSWQLLEPAPSQYNFQWLDDVLDVLDGHGLKAVLGTPTATPPKWLVDQNPEILPVGADGQVRKFGSRRHYSFSSPAYWAASQQIVTALAVRYGNHPAVAGWQIDNEFGCHSTVRSYDAAARIGFQLWLERQYGNVSTLNSAWGTIFWSQAYASFEEVDLPNLAVTEANPAAWMDFYRYSSDMVAVYAMTQVAILRQLSPDRFITHNFMGFFPEFDHFAFQKRTQLDFASWDNYPLGFTDIFLGPEEVFTEEEKLQFSRTGHPDIAAIHHDLYYSVGQTPFWVMEQQPGPVNWATHNPSPAPGMVRLWSLEAFAHGAAVVSYFRWRQVPFAQEQMHAGLYRPDDVADVAVGEVQRVMQDLSRVHKNGGNYTRGQAKVAVLFDYEAQWYLQIQPQGFEVRYFRLFYHVYSALRKLGVSPDIVPAGRSLKGYSLVIVPCLPHVTPEAAAAFAEYKGVLVLGPKTGSKTFSFQIPSTLPPGPVLQQLLPIKVTRVDALRPGDGEPVAWQFATSRTRNALPEDPKLSATKKRPGTSGRFGSTDAIGTWREHLELVNSSALTLGTFADGTSAIVKVDKPAGGEVVYLAFWPLGTFLPKFLTGLLSATHVPYFANLPSTLRITHLSDYGWAFNYGAAPQHLPLPGRTKFIIGANPVEPFGVTCWRVTSS